MLGTLTTPIRSSTLRPLLILIGMGIMTACSEERPLGQKPADPLLFLSIDVPYTTAIDVIDTGPDTVIQRMPDAGSVLGYDLHTTRDGAYLVTFYLVHELSVFDVSTLTEVASTPTKSVRVALSSAPPRVIGWSDDSVFFYNLPHLDRDTSFAMAIDFC